MKKSERRVALLKHLEENPFATDEQLADVFQVSVATIRLDRNALHIPEVRERIRQVATERSDVIRSMEHEEILGEVIELHLNRFAVSVQTVLPNHVFARTGIMRGHFLFGQVNSLAVAVMDADVAVTAKTELRFYRSVRLGETLRARVDVVAMQGGIAKCRAYTKVGPDTVLDGWIWIGTEPTQMNNLEDD